MKKIPQLRRPGLAPAAAMMACASVFAATGAGWAGPASAAATAHAAKHYFACTGGASVPCTFSTPSGNVHCRWSPTPNNVTCVRLRGGLAYQLRPTGKAVRVHVAAPRRGQTLPTNQTVVFPNKLSCHDTNTSMTCNQDFGTGAFTL